MVNNKIAGFYMVKMPTKKRTALTVRQNLLVIFYCEYKNFCHDYDSYQWQWEKWTKIAVPSVQIVLLEYQYTHICDNGIQQ